MKILIVVDMQKDFISGPLGTAEARAIVPYVAEKAKNTPRENLFVTLDTHQPNYMETNEGRHLPVPHCIKPEKGWEIAPSLKPFVEKAAVVEKPTFGSLELPKVIAGLEPDAIELVGLCTDICVIANAMILKAAFP